MEQDVLDYLIIGAGPAGLQLGYLLGVNRRSYRILEAGDGPGYFFRTFPRHRQLISINKRYTGSTDPELNLRMDWNSLLSADPEMLFTRYSERYFPAADEMVRYLEHYAKTFALSVTYSARVVRVRKVGEGFIVTDQRGVDYSARRVVVATGVSLENIPDIPGVQLAENYSTVSVNKRDFIDQRVLILGKGNSAFETADHLVETAAVIHVAGPNSVRLAWSSHFVGHLRAVNNNFLDTYQLKSQNALLDGQVLSIERGGSGAGYRVRFSFVRADEKVMELNYDRIICCTGFRFDSSIFDEECLPQPAINGRFVALTPAYESVNVPGLYFAGTLMQERDFKKSTGGFIHGFRYAVRSLSRIFEERYHDRPWPSVVLDSSPSAMAEAVIARVNRSSALWQQFGVLGDLLVAGPGEPARYHEEVPVEHAHGSPLTQGQDYFVITLEYGPDHDKVDPFDVTVRRVAQNSLDGVLDAAYLHPVVRHYRAGQLLGVHHLAENLANQWDDPDVHQVPLADFLARELGLESANVGR
ncbi:MAG TPA: NAD(P)-binding domain-containing protein [Kineosporiaceae bacterium]